MPPFSLCKKKKKNIEFDFSRPKAEKERKTRGQGSKFFFSTRALTLLARFSLSEKNQKKKATPQSRILCGAFFAHTFSDEKENIQVRALSGERGRLALDERARESETRKKPGAFFRDRMHAPSPVSPPSRNLSPRHFSLGFVLDCKPQAGEVGFSLSKNRNRAS